MVKQVKYRKETIQYKSETEEETTIKNSHIPLIVCLMSVQTLLKRFVSANNNIPTNIAQELVERIDTQLNEYHALSRNDENTRI